MAGRFSHVISVAHSAPGRVRLRLFWLHDSPGEGPAIADRLSALEGIEGVEVRPYTGSILCRFDPTRLDERRIVREACDATGVGPGETRGCSAAELRQLARVAQAEGSAISHATAALFKGMDADVLCATEGRLNLATTAALGLATAGVVNVIATKRLALPSWFDLAWWAYSVFSREERKAFARTPHPLELEPE
jgi:hypothetical protein